MLYDLFDILLFEISNFCICQIWCLFAICLRMDDSSNYARIYWRLWTSSDINNVYRLKCHTCRIKQEISHHDLFGQYQKKYTRLWVSKIRLDISGICTCRPSEQFSGEGAILIFSWQELAGEQSDGAVIALLLYRILGSQYWSNCNIKGKKVAKLKAK